ncbi:conserved hypothetical protein [Ricinus communis]|uniref:Uncharacterized protein n=1 Tax=Ricinus communis TaxID=3988 RepID=B9SPI9_RICCO|nr:conserved hypothetical protein [Ricinus communis]
MEQFSPATLLQELRLIGGLVKITGWISSMENLTTRFILLEAIGEPPSQSFIFFQD